MDKQEKRDLAKKLGEKYFKQGYNCTQAVYMALCQAEGEEVNSEIMKAGAGFGYGMGNGGTCGAIIGAVMATGLENFQFNGKPDNRQAVKKAKILQKKFLKRHPSVDCKTLRDSKPEEFKKIHDYCLDIVKDCTEIASGYLD